VNSYETQQNTPGPRFRLLLVLGLLCRITVPIVVAVGAAKARRTLDSYIVRPSATIAMARPGASRRVLVRCILGYNTDYYYLGPVQPPVRRILHIDMDAFYASVEQRDNPDLRGKPVAVGGDAQRRGVVAAASYEARKYGVRSAIPMARAVRLCPHLLIVKPDFRKYKAASEAVFEIFRSVTPLVEPMSLDEAYLDVTENAWGEPLGRNVALRIKAAIKEATNLTASAGVAPNKFLAKIASAWKKPDGLTVIAPERVERFLQNLPVDALWGVGPVTAARLRERGIERLVDVRSADEEVLRDAVGSWSDWLRQLANGIDDRDVEPHHDPKSSGSENTYAQDLTDILEIRQEIDAMARDAAEWLDDHRLLCRTVTIKVRYSDFTTITRSHSKSPATRDDEDIAQRAVKLLDRTDAATRPVRLLGVSVHNLEDPSAPFEPEDREPWLPFGAEP
jgi:DNA polymerase-4